MEHFAARIALSTPVLTKDPLNLDAILWHRLTARMGGDYNAAHSYIPLGKDPTGSCFTASSAFFEPGPAHTQIVQRSFMHSAMTMPIEALQLDRSRRNTIHGEPTYVSHHIRDNRGDFQNFASTYEARATEAVWFAGYGYPNHVEDLLHTVTNLGTRRNAGQGQVESIDMFEVNPEPFVRGLFSYGLGLIEPLRPVPLHVCEAMKIDHREMVIASHRYQPPYWLAEHEIVPCAVPTLSVRARHNIERLLGVGS